MSNDRSNAARNKQREHSRKRIVLHAFALRRHVRDVFLLGEIQELTIAEAAAILDISAALVKTRLRRAHREIGARVRAPMADRLSPTDAEQLAI
jgi:DNA-directed RNA polymerase specialized sigma24 family protein